MLARFEDDGGVLPVHQVGLEAGGHVRFSNVELEYVGVVSNGHDREPDKVQNFGDRNAAKAYDLGFSLAADALRGAKAGADFHADEIPPVPNQPARGHDMRELIGTFYLEYYSGPLEALGEFALIDHRDRVADRDFTHRLGYVQLGYHIADFTPYLRFEIAGMEKGDPFYAPEDADLDRWEQMFGLRYELTEYAAIKFEGGFGREERRRGSGAVSRGDFGRMAGQLAWVF
jgi:hypothetical protein